MAIDKLNFSGINSGSESLVTPIGSLSERLMKYGSILNQNALEQEKQKRIDMQDAYQKQRDNIVDSRYEADKKERLDDKNRLLQKDYNTANAMSAIENKDAYIAGRMSSEQKAIQDTLASATPEERLQMQQELKGYDPKASGQQWADTALSQSNVDSKDIINLKGDLRKEAEQIRQYNENKRIAQENFNKTYSLQKQRDNIIDSRYEADKKERLNDKFDAKQKEIATNENLALISDKDSFLAGKTSAEDKAYSDAINTITDPVEKQRLQSEYNAYKNGSQKQSWANAVSGQTNVDQKQIVDLRRNLAQDDQSAKDKKEIQAGELAYVKGLNTNVDNSTKTFIDSKTGEKYIPDENLNAHKTKFEEFTNSPEMIKMKNELVDAQKNGGQIYTKEQLADPVFMKKLYDESQVSKKPQGNITFESIMPNFKMMKDLEPYGKKINDLNRNVVANRNATGSDIENAKKEIEIANSEINRIKNEYSKKDSSDSYSTYEDFSAKIKADNAAKELDLKTKIDKYDSAYKAQDLKLKNEFGKIKQEEIVIPKSEDQYAQDLYNENTAGKTLSVKEQVGFMKAAKEKAAAHQKKVDKDEADALTARLKQMEKATEAQKLEYNTYDDQIKTLNDQISKITTGNASKEDLYSRVTSKEVNPGTAILELKTEIEQLKALQKGLANKIKN